MYFFDNLPPGDYQVQVDMSAISNVVPSTTQVADPEDNVAGDSNIATIVGSVYTSGTITLSNDSEPSGVSEASSLTTNGDSADAANDDNGNMTVDFGFFVPVVSLGSVIWNDANNNGTQDAGEVGIAGAVVTLLDGMGNPVVGVMPQTTGADGTYYFGNLPEGNYQVQVDMSAISNVVPSTTQVADPEDNVAGDSNIATTVGSVYTSETITLTNDDEPSGTSEVSPLSTNGDTADSSDDDNGNMTVDFGFYTAATMTIPTLSLWGLLLLISMFMYLILFTNILKSRKS